MARHSFIQIEKIKNVKGRIQYISSYARQENLYATMNTTDNKFWQNLSKENQQEFMKSGTSGTCIEARELIIALPEVYTEYAPQKVLELFTSSFYERHGVECISALHHNKRKTNYHIHLIFSERKLLEEPIVKIASRNMFYNEQGRHVRTKKEITDGNGGIREGCKIIAKGEVYKQRWFSNKELYFKSEKFLEEEKKYFTELINCYVKNPEKKLQVFQKNNLYLPTKKIGKNNPKSEEIRVDNNVRMDWNQTVDLALIERIPEIDILKVKKKEISQQVRDSTRAHGQKPGLFREIVLLAKKVLEKIIQKSKLPPKPQLTVDIQEFHELQDIHAKLLRQAQAIERVEQQEIPELENRLCQLGRIFKRNERKTVEQKIGDMEVRLANMKESFYEILSRKGYKTVQEFMHVYGRSEELVFQYQQDLQKWKEKSTDDPPKKQGVRTQLRQYQNDIRERDRKAIKYKDRGGR